MNLRKRNLTCVFFITALLTLFTPNLFPSIRLYFFIPFLVIAIYQLPLITCLWLSILCGTIVDLFGDGARLGFFAMNFCITTFLLYPQKKFFFADSITTLPLMTLFFSIGSTLIEIAYRYSTGKLLTLNAKWVVTDLLVWPLADSIYAFLFFILPFFIFGKPERRGRDYFS